MARAAVDWLHEFLSALTGTGFDAPKPVRDLDGSSIAVVDGAIWELLTHVPGRQMSWDADLREAGRALAYLHVASLALPPRPQRPGAMPFETCRPADPRVPVAEIQRELAQISTGSSTQCVIHGDPTFNNMVVGPDGTWGLIDFTIAFQASPLADIACGLWRTGRVGPDALTYDPGRIAAFVAGYSSVRPLGADAARAIPVYLSARGLQLRERHERQGRSDETVRAIRAERPAIEEAIREALSGVIHGVAEADARREDLRASAARFCVKCGRKLIPPSDPQLKPHCPGCGWFQATSALPVALVLARSPSGRVPYTRQRGWPENAWGLVAGYVEAGETADVAALREVREETGLVARSPRVLRTLTWRDLVLIVVSVEVDDLEPVVGAELEAAMLTAPDLRLTPTEWPAHAVVLDHIGDQR